MAWRKLGVVLGNRGQERSRAFAALTKAYEHRDRLSRRERLLTMSTYYSNVTDETEKAIAQLENLADMDPSDSWALNNLSVLWGELEEHERGEEYGHLAVRADSSNPLHYENTAAHQVYQGKFEEARATIDALARRVPETPRSIEYRAYLASAQLDHGAAEEALAELRQREARSLYWRAFTSDLLGSLAANEGKLAAAEAHYRDAMGTNVERDLPGEYLESALQLASLQARFADDPSEAISTLAAAVERAQFAELDPLDRPYLDVVRLHASVGQVGRARDLLAEFGSTEAGSVGNAESTLHWMRGVIALAESRHEEAISELQRVREYYCRVCGIAELAQAYDLSDRPDSAIALYERFVDTRAAFRIFDDRGELGPAYERLGQLYDEAGDRKKAAEYYAKFVELWADADPELQPRVGAAQRRIDEIFAETG